MYKRAGSGKQSTCTRRAAPAWRTPRTRTRRVAVDRHRAVERRGRRGDGGARSGPRARCSRFDLVQPLRVGVARWAVPRRDEKPCTQVPRKGSTLRLSRSGGATPRHRGISARFIDSASPRPLPLPAWCRGRRATAAGAGFTRRREEVARPVGGDLMGVQDLRRSRLQVAHLEHDPLAVWLHHEAQVRRRVRLYQGDHLAQRRERGVAEVGD